MTKDLETWWQLLAQKSEDESLRLVFADWCEESGHEQLGNALRVAIITQYRPWASDIWPSKYYWYGGNLGYPNQIGNLKFGLFQGLQRGNLLLPHNFCRYYDTAAEAERDLIETLSRYLPHAESSCHSRGRSGGS